jgi:hypothetical protein
MYTGSKYSDKNFPWGIQMLPLPGDSWCGRDTDKGTKLSLLHPHKALISIFAPWLDSGVD